MEKKKIRRGSITPIQEEMRRAGVQHKTKESYALFASYTFLYAWKQTSS